ncbi:hypothetical protein Mapa_008693 [Marchantia paleacea]|nr:hypothetical protein Mapa_008693 [Marchantia paleacea]
MLPLPYLTLLGLGLGLALFCFELRCRPHWADRRQCEVRILLVLLVRRSPPAASRPSKLAQATRARSRSVAACALDCELRPRHWILARGFNGRLLLPLLFFPPLLCSPFSSLRSSALPSESLLLLPGRPSALLLGLGWAGWLAVPQPRLRASFLLSPFFSALSQLWGWAGWTDPTCPAWTAPGWLARCQGKASRRVCVLEFWFRCCCCCVRYAFGLWSAGVGREKIGRGEGGDRREKRGEERRREGKRGKAGWCRRQWGLLRLLLLSGEGESVVKAGGFGERGVAKEGGERERERERVIRSL